MPVEAFIRRWHSHKRLVEPAQRILYETIAEQVHGLNVCDAGSGAGLGSLILAQEAQAVVGVEIVKDAVKFSNKCFPVKNLMFIHSSITDFDSPIAFDAIVAIELIEHIADYHSALDSIRTLLDDDGVLYVSSPNRNAPNVGRDTPRNERHVREWTAGEFQEILSLYFSDVRLYDRTLILQNTDTILSPILAVCTR